MSEISRRGFLAALALAPLAPLAGLAAKLAGPRPANVRRSLIVGAEAGKLAGVEPGRADWTACTDGGDEYWALAS